MIAHPAIHLDETLVSRHPRSVHGFRIAVISDIPLSLSLGRDFAQRVVDAINSTQPDLIDIVGNLVEDYATDLSSACTPDPAARTVWQPPS